MSPKILKITTLIAAGALAGAAPALALDGQVVLDQLVKKGILTQQEADAMVAADAAKKQATPTPVVVQETNPDITQIKVFGGVQADAKYTTHNNVGGVNNQVTPGSGFELRRFNLGVEGKVGSNWSVFGMLEMDAGNTGTNSNGNVGTTLGPNGQNGTVQLTNGSRYDIIIDKAGITYDTVDYGTITFGLQKAHFGMEDYTSAYDIDTIERSPESFYFGYYYETGQNGTKTALNGNLTVGGRKIGLYWDKAFDKNLSSFAFGAGVSNAYDDSYTFQTNNGEQNFLPEFYANAGYRWIISKESSLESDLNLTYTGANTGQITDGSNTAAGTSVGHALAGAPGSNADFNTTTTGIEWITRYKYKALTLTSDVMSAYVTNGRYETGYAAGHANDAMPLGVTFTAKYRITEELEPVLQLGYLETDGRGVQEGGVTRDYNNTSSVAFDRCYNVYAGINWYITPKSLKLTAGFEGTQFAGLANGVALPAGQTSNVQDYGARVQLQARF